MVGNTSADLAEDGFTGAPAIVCEAGEAAVYWNDLCQVWRMREMNFKAYPVCRWAQPPIEAALSLMDKHQVKAADIEEILVTTFHEATRLDTYRPKDSDEAQYNLPFSVALALLHGTVLPEHLLPLQFNQTIILELADKVKFLEKVSYNKAFPGERYADVALKLANGTTVLSQPEVAMGNYDAPMEDVELIQKFNQYACRALSPTARESLEKILNVPKNSPSLSEIVSYLQ